MKGTVVSQTSILHLEQFPESVFPSVKGPKFDPWVQPSKAKLTSTMSFLLCMKPGRYQVLTAVCHGERFVAQASRCKAFEIVTC